MKKLLFLVVGLSLFFSLVACSSNNDSEKSNSNREDNNSAKSSNDIIENGVLTVGTEGTYAPFTFHDESGELTGYDVEVIKEVAKRLGVEVKFEETQWDSMFAGLNAERFDLIANQVGITEERLESYEFSDPYTYSAAVVVVPTDNEDITSFKDIKGKKSAQSLTSNFGAIAEEFGAEVVGVEGLAQAIEQLKHGRADVTVNDKLAVLDYLNQQGDDRIKIVAQEDDVSETAFCFNKGNEKLIEAVNEQLEAMREDGTLAQIAEEWFGEDVSIK